MSANLLEQLVFSTDRLSVVMLTLVTFIGVVSLTYAKRFMAGDAATRAFYCKFSFLILVLGMLVLSNHLVLTFVLWGISDLLLISLMMHKSNWIQAIAAGRLTAKTLLAGWVCLGVAFFLLYQHTGTANIQQVIQLSRPIQTDVLLATVLIVVAAITQSAIWPCQRWLLSSLNSPTPVSAIMHAGLVNGGGWLLVRFGELILMNGIVLNAIFFLGLISAVLGGLWKLQQQDIKRMLACSTLSQMGFMFMLIGAGLLPIAICHLFLHGMFKANLFLTSNRVGLQPRLAKQSQYSLPTLSIAMSIGLLATLCCAEGMHQQISEALTTLWLILGFVWITCTQLSLVLLKEARRSILLNMFSICLLAYFYGIGYFLLDHFFDSLHLFYPQPLNMLHIIAFFICCSLWLFTVCGASYRSSGLIPAWWKKYYMLMLNASQPHPDTITANRHSYRI